MILIEESREKNGVRVRLWGNQEDGSPRIQNFSQMQEVQEILYNILTTVGTVFLKTAETGLHAPCPPPTHIQISMQSS